MRRKFKELGTKIRKIGKNTENCRANGVNRNPLKKCNYI
jgi:hypothetical protein